MPRASVAVFSNLLALSGLMLSACSGSATPGSTEGAAREATGSSGSAAAKPESAEYEAAYRIGSQAYTYGLPLVVTDLTYRTMTSVPISEGAYGPVNQFNNVRAANTSKSTAVVAPGSTSLSSIAWLDLREQPQVLHVPEVVDHFFVLALIDPYTTNIHNFGTAAATAPGDYVLTGPGQEDAAIPAGTTQVKVDYSRIWIIGSTQLKNAADVANVVKIQDGYQLTPLSSYGIAAPSQAAQPTDSQAPSPVAASMPSGLAFFDRLGELLAAFPPPAAQQADVARFASVGIGANLVTSEQKLSPDTVRGLTDAVAAGPQSIQAATQELVKRSAGTHRGYLLGGFGDYGTNYQLRAVISQIGLGAFVPQQAIYAMAWSDDAGQALTGEKSYVLHLEKAPPTSEGWSLTVYNLRGQLIENSEQRHAFTNTSDLTRNADGSVDFYLQADKPTDSAKQANWLPVGGDGFEVTWRLFAPQPAEVDPILQGSGWQPPAITPAG